jgi:hypothetical protein
MKKAAKKSISILWSCVWVFVILNGVGPDISRAITKPSEKQEITSKENYPQDVPHKLSAVYPNVQQRVHRVGLLNICMTNWGFFGNGQGHPLYDLKESLGGCFNPHPDEEVLAPSAEYPAGSGIEYLFWGGFWIGAIDRDTVYTTVGCDGWQWVHELFPDGPDPKGSIEERTTRPGSECYSPEAVSEQDIIAVYTDTSAEVPLSPQRVDTWDQRKHHPLNVQITQKSYSWSYEYAEDFVLIDFTIKNIGVRKLKEMYVGLYVDADVAHKDEDPYGAFGAQDDICGFRQTVTVPKGDCYDTVNLAWISDNDGHGLAGENIFTPVSPIGVTGTRVVRSPKPGLKYSFNWFISNSTGYPWDWGPWMTKSQKKWEEMEKPASYGGVTNTFPGNVLGTPGGDVSKYFMMSNGEFDYDQIYSCVWPTKYPAEGWLPVNEQACGNLANGYDTRYLLSFGPFDEIGPGESLLITIGYIAGDNFHVDPLNLAKDPNMRNPDRFYANLDFSDFETNATWAAKVYDNPTLDNPCGDGVPDFAGPPPPPPPVLNFHTQPGKVKITWNGEATEKTRDSFNGTLDFEGYRIYMSRTENVADYALLGSYDRIDYKIYKLNRVIAERPWDWEAASVSTDSLKSWLDRRGTGKDSLIGDNPLIWTKTNPFVINIQQDTFYIYLSDSLKNGIPVAYDSIRLAPGDSLYFEAQDWNVGLDSILVNKAYRDSVDGGLISGEVDSSYYAYEYEIEVFPGQPLYFAVTAFDVGDPPTGLSPLEASKLVNATLVYPVEEPEAVKKEGLKVVVYPNPYRVDGNYYQDGYEPGQRNFDKRLNFINLPSRCTIRIYTLDGDLVRSLEHDTQEGDLDATYAYWDLISRNTQAVVSGIYLFSVKDKDTGETQVGKFVIIK